MKTSTKIIAHYAIKTDQEIKAIGIKANYIDPVATTAYNYSLANIKTIAQVTHGLYKFTLEVEKIEAKTHFVICISIAAIDDIATQKHVIKSTRYILPEDMMLPHYKYLTQFILMNAKLCAKTENAPIASMIHCPLGDAIVFVHRIKLDENTSTDNRALPVKQFPEEGSKHTPVILNLTETTQNGYKFISGVYSLIPVNTTTPPSQSFMDYGVYVFWNNIYNARLKENYKDFQKEVAEGMRGTDEYKFMSEQYDVAYDWFHYVLDVLGIRTDTMNIDELNLAERVMETMAKTPETVIRHVYPDTKLNIHRVRSALHVMKGISQEIRVYL